MASNPETTIEQLRALTGPVDLNCGTLAELTDYMADALFLAWFHQQSPEDIARIQAELAEIQKGRVSDT